MAANFGDVTLLRFRPDALQASRFAVSPLAETLSEFTRLRQALDRRATSNPQVEAFSRWLDTDPFVDGLLRLATAATKYLPDFVAIPPAAGLHGKIANELDAMRAIDDEAQRYAWASDGIAWADVSGVAGRAADVIAEGWARFVEPDWVRRRAIMERDIHHRAGRSRPQMATRPGRHRARRPVGRARRDPVLHTELRRQPHRERRPRLRPPHGVVRGVLESAMVVMLVWVWTSVDYELDWPPELLHSELHALRHHPYRPGSSFEITHLLSETFHTAVPASEYNRFCSAGEWAGDPGPGRAWLDDLLAHVDELRPFAPRPYWIERRARPSDSAPADTTTPAERFWLDRASFTRTDISPVIILSHASMIRSRPEATI